MTMNFNFTPSLFQVPQTDSEHDDFNVIGGEIFATFSPWASWLSDGNPFAPAPAILLPATADGSAAQGNVDSTVAVTSGGITINLIYDTAALNAPQGFRDGIQKAVAIMASAISDKITVNIKIDYSGTGRGAAAGPDNGRYEDYSWVRANLVNNATPGDATFNALTAGSTIQGQSNVAVWNAQLKLWGVIGANDTTTDDGAATFATDIDPNLLVGVALHELTHAMGRVPYGASSQPDIFDFDRFTAPGTRLFLGGATAPAAYFSLDGGITKLADYGRTSDPSDFLNSGVQGANDPFNEFYGGGTSQQLTATDLKQLVALGFHLLTSNHVPVVSAHDTSLAAGHSIAAASMITSVTDQDNDAITQYAVYDAGGAGGHFVINGQALAAGQWGVASNLGAVNYVGGSSAGSETLFFSASDGQGWSNSVTVTATTTANHVPVVSAHDTSLAAGHSIAAASMITSVTDQDNDAITQYAFYDAGGAGGHFVINGQTLAAGQWGVASSLAAVSYVGGASPGSETLFISASDGVGWSSSVTVTATTTVNHAPVVSAPDTSLATGHSINAATMISVTDQDGDAISQYAFYDTGAAGGHFVINGKPLAAGTWGTSSSLAAVSYVSGSSPGSETLFFSASDGQAWSNSVTVNATTTGNHAPVVTAQDVSVVAGHSINAVTMISATDQDGDVVSQYAFYDTGAAGGHFVINGQPLAAGTWGSASSLAAVSYVGGSSAGSETLFFSASDGQTWSNSVTATATTSFSTAADIALAHAHDWLI
jgi:hypothetical protein